jgi:hypothetical protein
MFQLHSKQASSARAHRFSHDAMPFLVANPANSPTARGSFASDLCPPERHRARLRVRASGDWLAMAT